MHGSSKCPMGLGLDLVRMALPGAQAFALGQGIRRQLLAQAWAVHISLGEVSEGLAKTPVVAAAQYVSKCIFLSCELSSDSQHVFIACGLREICRLVTAPPPATSTPCTHRDPLIPLV